MTEIEIIGAFVLLTAILIAAIAGLLAHSGGDKWPAALLRAGAAFVRTLRLAAAIGAVLLVVNCPEGRGDGLLICTEAIVQPCPEDRIAGSAERSV